MKNIFKISFFLLLTMTLSILMLTQNRWRSERQPANEQMSSKEYDLSEATPEEFKTAFKYQLMKAAHIEQTPVGPGIVLGMFLIKGDQGYAVPVCDKYRTVDLIFKADGVAASGGIPTLIVRGPCLVSLNQLSLKSLPLPLSQILKSPHNTREFSTDIPGSSEKAKIFAQNFLDYWPDAWVWSGVTLYGKVGEPSLNINGYEIISVLGKPLIITAE